jgi:hypothetical protein
MEEFDELRAVSEVNSLDNDSRNAGLIMSGSNPH